MHVSFLLLTAATLAVGLAAARPARAAEAAQAGKAAPPFAADSSQGKIVLADVPTHQRFAESLSLSFPLVSDPGGAIQKQYGSGRIAFFIDTRASCASSSKGCPTTKRSLPTSSDCSSEGRAA